MRLRPRRRGHTTVSRGLPATVCLLHDGDQALPAMLSAIEGAQREILLEMYWFGSDRTGRRFAAALEERARAGVSVRLIYDAVGSLGADRAMFQKLQKAGVDVLEYNPVVPWRERFSMERIPRRDHRKLLVIDARAAILGGINLGDPWAPLAEGGLGFRDDAVLIEGPAVSEMRALFYRTLQRDAPLLEAVGLPCSGPQLRHEAEVQVLAGELRRDRRGIYDSYINAIARASRDILIAASYFIPSRRMRRALARAVERGVRVRVLVPRNSDVPVAQYASRALYETLIDSGVEIFEWWGGVLHSKTAVIDDDWCTIGSFNFDALSTHNNLELNVAVFGSSVATALRKRVEGDLALADRVELAIFRKRSPLTKLTERAFYLMRWAL